MSVELVREYRMTDLDRCVAIVNEVWDFDTNIEPPTLADFVKRFYVAGTLAESRYARVIDRDGKVHALLNNDGSIAEMCGNGARCAARYAYRHAIAGEIMKFETIAGVIEAEILGEQEHVSVKMTDPEETANCSPMELDGTVYQIDSINTGVPHAVIFVDTDDVPVAKWGREVRYHHQFEPAGTNVNFVRVTPEGELHVRTYERGVEAETLACGTGAVAAALIAADRALASSPAYVVTGGGEQLVVQFQRTSDTYRDVYLQGAARVIYEGDLQAEALL